jgi:S-adenosylmethionine:tRNA ribosyltransferase-isomerase
VGIGTFAPVRSTQVEDHDMEGEWIDIPAEVTNQIDETKRRGGRVIAVGTTTTRALESAADPEGRIKSGRVLTHLYIYPSYRFRAIDGLITNFHLEIDLDHVGIGLRRENSFCRLTGRPSKKYRFFVVVMR